MIMSYIAIDTNILLYTLDDFYPQKAKIINPFTTHHPELKEKVYHD